ncbi:MAG: FAD-binding oxidoreductase [Rhizobiales bacterium]|nr:FAD-binding oxidoreductase [Hyphomicrobiales bacterium]
MKCDAIVIGGGVVGLSAALCLLEAGLKQVLILERQVLASGGTGLGTGSVHTQRWFATDSDLVLRSKHIISQISERSGGVFQLFSVGRLTVVGEADAQIVVDYGRHLRDCGIEAVELSPEALLKRYPGMNVSDVGAALFTPEDGVVYPPAMIWALAGAIRRAGGNIWEGCGASRIVIENGATRGVQLLNGDVLECGRVVVAAGVWSRRVLQSSGLDLALKHSITHNTVVTVGRVDRWSEVPSLLDGVQGIIAIPRNPGTIMSANTAGEYESPSATAERVLNATTVELREASEVFRQETAVQQREVMMQLRHRYRDYDIRGVVGHWAGLLDGTPDNHPYIGPYPGVGGLWVGCGLTGYGVQRGPGVGETLAALAMDKEPQVDVSHYGLGRFDAKRDFRIDLSSDNPFAGFRTTPA